MSTAKIKQVIFLATLVIAVAAFWVFKRQENAVLIQSALEKEKSTAASDTSLETQPQSAQSDPESTNKTLQALSLPKSQEVKDEMLEDSHHTPESILKFAEELAPHLEQALENAESAAMVFQFLEQCVKAGEEVSESIKIMCMINAQRVSRKFPDAYQEKSLKLRGRLNLQAQKIVDSYFQ